MSDINKDEADRQKREAEQAAAAASAQADQANAEVARLRGIVEGIVSLPAQAADIMAALQTTRVRVETDACQVSTVLVDLKAAQDKAVAIINDCRGHEVACKAAAVKAESEAGVAIRAAEAVRGRAEDTKSALVAATGCSKDIHDLCVEAQEAVGAIKELRAKAERDVKSERKKSWLGLILAALALVVAVGAVVAFYHFGHIHPVPVADSQPPAPAATAPVSPTVTPAPPAPAPFTISPVVDKNEFTRYCVGNGLTSDECEAAWKRYTE